MTIGQVGIPNNKPRKSKQVTENSIFFSNAYPFLFTAFLKIGRVGNFIKKTK
uniref:Uncharacterized protein n=1 Tax=Rhizophora mucronata TaxID=61149 RepID=A0A2P2Q6I0_RHIMU